jgi:hypothetical protein
VRPRGAATASAVMDAQAHVSIFDMPAQERASTRSFDGKWTQSWNRGGGAPKNFLGNITRTHKVGLATHQGK